MVEFKQIVGRGTRVYDGKDFFTILDFTGATNLFYDDEWDGLPDAPPEIIDVSGKGEKSEPQKKEPRERQPKENISELEEFTYEQAKEKLIVHLSNGRKLKVIDVEVRYVGDDGRPLTATEFLEKLIGVLPHLYESETQLRELWSKPETREELLTRLGQMGFDDEQMSSLQRMFEAQQSDIFDLLAFLSYNKDLITRSRRAGITKDNRSFFDVYTNLKAKDFLHFVLDRYEKDGIEELRRDHLSELVELNGLGTTKEAAKIFGNVNNLIGAFYQLQELMYKVG
jgi:type I restriction enzyme R subunit